MNPQISQNTLDFRTCSINLQAIALTPTGYTDRQRIYATFKRSLGGFFVCTVCKRLYMCLHVCAGYDPHDARMQSDSQGESPASRRHASRKRSRMLGMLQCNPKANPAKPPCSTSSCLLAGTGASTPATHPMPRNTFLNNPGDYFHTSRI